MKYFATLICTIISLSVFAQTKRTVDILPPPFATKSVKNFSNVIGWGDGEKPIAPEGFTVTKYADGFDNPRWMYVMPNGDVLVAETNASTSVVKKVGGAIIGAAKADNLNGSADRITLLRDTNHDGMPDKRITLLSGLKQPFGMLLLHGYLYVANTDALWRYPYKAGDTVVNMSKGRKIIDLPGGGRHWTRNIIAGKDGKTIYIAVGSSTNVAENGIEKELLRADILQINPDGSGEKVYASGLRNPVGMAWAPGTNTLWAAVNERDEIGDELVPDYLTGVVPGGFYGWPYAYFGQHIDPRVKEARPDLVKKTIVPDVNLGSHTASLGLLFYTGKAFPAKYRDGAFVAQHGSWNKSVLAGYRVVFVPFKNGKPAGNPEDFLTGFIADLDKGKVHGRPVGVVQLPDGSMLVTDDISNTIWRVAYNK